MAKTRAQENRAIRQEALRELLSKQKHIEHIIDNLKKMEELAPIAKEDDDTDYTAAKFNLDKLKIANEQRFKLVNKYLPDLKQTELVGEGGGGIEIIELQKDFDNN